MNYYKDYFTVRKDYTPCMTLRDINREPNRWLDYYPHETFVDLLNRLLHHFDNPKRTLWITGAYGTGKTHAALVLQKLFNDDESRVLEWLKRYEAQNLIPQSTRDALLKQRAAKTLVVFTSGATSVDPHNHFLVRIEKAIIAALKENGLKNPPKGRVDQIIERVTMLGEHFFAARDEIQDQLPHLVSGISTVEKLSKKLYEKENTGLLTDCLKVLNSVNVFPSLSSTDLQEWVQAILKDNGYARMVFIWDEFSDFVNNNKSSLKTFEEVAELAQTGCFYFCPVTHMNLSAYVAEGSDSANKAKDRFEFKALDMPTNTALKLAANALVPVEAQQDKWGQERDLLWSSTRNVVEDYMIPRNTGATASDFKNILPIHPMTAFLLMHLSTAIGSNQRSLFDFLNGHEFRAFITEGGLDVTHKQLLTVDYLWSYFIERDDEGLKETVRNARSEFSRHTADLQPEERRVLKAVLLYSVLERELKDGHELLQAMVDNIKRSFAGDGGILGVEQVIENLARRQSFSVVNGRCQMYGGRQIDDVELTRKKETLSGDFSKKVLEEKTAAKLSQQIKPYNYGNRYDVRAAGVSALTPGAIKLRETFGADGNKVLVQFILAKDHADELRVADKARELATHFREFRMVFMTMPGLTFCSKDAKRWEEYVDQLAKLDLAADNPTAKAMHSDQIKRIDEEWGREVIAVNQLLEVFWMGQDGSSKSEKILWSQLKGFLGRELKEAWFTAVTDDLSGYNMTVWGAPNALDTWALAGIQFDQFEKTGAYKSIIANYKNAGVSGETDWFDANPNHALTQMRDFCKKRLDNTVGQGNICSVRKLYIDLQRAPYGLLDVPHSAFVLGFVLREWLTGRRALQWTNGQLSMPLKADTLAEIIGAVVKAAATGEDKIKDEKVICRLSAEEMEFVKAVPTMFGIEPIPHATVEGALQASEQRIEKLSGKAPLWMLPRHIETQGDARANLLGEIIRNLCEAYLISSKGDTVKRSDCVKTIGRILLETPELKEAFAAYMKPDVFNAAFRAYIDEKKPGLKKQALEVEDSALVYYQAVRDRCVETSGWLWKDSDIDTELAKVSEQYDIIAVMRRLASVSGFIPYDEAMKRLCKAVAEDNKVSLACIRQKYPVLGTLIDAPDRVSAEFLTTHETAIKKVFFDNNHTEQLNIAKTLLGDTWGDGLSVHEEQGLYDAFGTWATLGEDEFKKQAAEAMRVFDSKRLARHLSETWKAKTGSESPLVWGKQNGIPAYFLFGGEQERNLIEAVTNPNALQHEKLQEVLDTLSDSSVVTTKEAETKFLEHVLPERYRKLKIACVELSEALREKLGEDANTWLEHPDLSKTIEAFVRKHYETHYKKTAMDKVKKLSGDDAKKQLLHLVENNPDTGLALLDF